MLSNVNHTNITAIISAVFLSLLLSWLTVSLPIVNGARQVKNKISNIINDDNSFAGTTEEKTPGTINLTEEFIHHSDHDFHISPFQISIAYIHAHESVYRAYHGEPPCPPPNFHS